MQLSDRARRDSDGLVKNLNRVGRVVERKKDKTGVYVRVICPDRQNLITKWLPVAQPGAGGMRTISCFRIGQEVLINHLGNSIEDGVVTAAIYTPTNPPPDGITVDQVGIQIDDGSFVIVDPATGDLLVDFKGPVNIKTMGPANIEAEGPVTVKSAADVRLESAGDITLRAGGEIILETGGGGPRIRIMANGDMLQPDGEHEDRLGKHSGGRERKEEEDDL
jgi:phage baseplate assembly protein V